MKKGFIEKIEGNNVYVIFDDNSSERYDKNQFSTEIKIDMVVEIKDKKIFLSPPNEDLKNEIKKITEKIFVPFKNRKKK